MRNNRLCIPLLTLLAACASNSPIKPVESLDERSGMTVASLAEPLELMPDTQTGLPSAGRRLTFVYVGPVEWDRAGTISNGLWVHIAPGNDKPLTDIRSPRSASLILDDGPVDLTAMSAPATGRAPYKPVVSWGQTVYFELDEKTLERMAKSSKIVLAVRAQDDSVVSFVGEADAHATLAKYAKGRGITVD